jgi:dihydrofolate reductase
MPKYVVSSTLEDPEWNNSTVLKGDVVTEVSKLRRDLKGEVVVVASFQPVRTLMEHDLVDELRLKIYPVVLGAGERLFGDISDERPMRLVAPRLSTATSRSSPTNATGRSRSYSGPGEASVAAAYRTGSPIPRRLPSLSRNQAPRSPVPLLG